MKTITGKGRAAALSLALALYAAGWAVAPLAAQRPSYEGLLDYMEQIRNDNDLPGLSVAVAVDGEIVFSEGVGYAELDNRTPAAGRTVHNVGSVSKVLAVVGLMQLVEQGRVDLDATIQTYMPWYPERAHPITVRHILTHTSGIRHYNGVEFGPHDLLRLRHYDDFEEATELWRDDPLAYETGTGWMYSSHAHNLQHGIVEGGVRDGLRGVSQAVRVGAGGHVRHAVRRSVAGRAEPRSGVRARRVRQVRPRPARGSELQVRGGRDHLERGGSGPLRARDQRRAAARAGDGGRDAPVAAWNRGSARSTPSSPDGLGEPIAHEQALAWFIRHGPGGAALSEPHRHGEGDALVPRQLRRIRGRGSRCRRTRSPSTRPRYGEAIAQMFLP